MNKKIIEYLENIDMTEHESELYLLLIESGPVSVKDLAAKAGIKRPTAYIYLDQLIEKGLVMKIVKGTNKLVAAVDPEVSLQKLVKDKMQLALEMEKKFPQIIERIHEVLPKETEVGEAEIKFYKGKNNAQKIYIDALQSNEFRSYIRIDKNESLFPNNAQIFSNALKKNKNLKIWEIIYDPNESALPSQESQSYKGRYFYKFMSQKQTLSSEDILIYDGKVGILNFRGQKSSILLQSPDLYNNFKEIFDAIWGMLPSPK